MPGLLTVVACGLGVILLRLPRPILPPMSKYNQNNPVISDAQALAELRALIASDAYAMTFQSAAQYRAALTQTIDQHQSQVRIKTPCAN